MDSKSSEIKNFSIVKNIFILLLPFMLYSITYLVPSLHDVESPEYKKINQSKLSLPSWLLFMLWSIIYIIMGSSMVKVVDQKQYLILSLYIIQILTNTIRAISINKLHNVNLAFIMAIVFFLVVVFNNYIFFKRSKKSGRIFIVYSLWAFYILYLQISMKFNLF